MARLPQGVSVTLKLRSDDNRVLTPEALGFVAGLHRAFEAERQLLLRARVDRNKQYAGGLMPDFRPTTSAIRDGGWRVASAPRGLQDLRLGIVAPVHRKAVINALNSGARIFVADFEDATVPLWDHVLEGHRNLVDRWTSAMEHVDPGTGRRVALGQKPAALLVRPRALHAAEEHVVVDGKPVAASLFDVGLYLFHNATTAIAKNAGPWFDLAKLETHEEALWWANVFRHAESLLGLPLGTIRATVSIETLPAVFEMDEILFALRDHAIGLGFTSCSIAASFIRTMGTGKASLLPARLPESGGGFLPAAAALLIRTCHRRGAAALGGMLTEVPRRDDEALRDESHWAIEHAAREGFDGIIAAHPDLVPLAAGVFCDLVPTSNQHYVSRDDAVADASGLRAPPPGGRSDSDILQAIREGASVIEGLLRGQARVNVDGGVCGLPALDLRRSQLWQWLAGAAPLDGGGKLTRGLLDALFATVAKTMKAEAGDEAWAEGRFKEALAILKSMVTAKELAPHLLAVLAKRLP